MFGPSLLDGAGAKRQTRETYFLNTPRIYRVGQKSGNTLVTFERIKVESCN